MRRKPVHRAELLLPRWTDFPRAEPIYPAQSWKNAEKWAFFLKNKLNNYGSIFGKKCGVNRFMPHWFIYVASVKIYKFHKRLTVFLTFGQGLIYDF